MILKKFFQTFEFRRKVFHFVLGLALVFFINSNNYIVNNYLVQSIIIALICSVILSQFTKFRKPKLILRFLRLFDKPKDLVKFPGKGAVYYLIGVLIAVLLFEKNITLASITILAVGDPAAFFIGKYYGNKRLVFNKNKVLEGTLAGTFLGTIGASFFVPIPIAFFGAAFGMIAETIEFEIFKLDDNFFIPFVSGAVMTLLIMLL
jgi:phytol kinase